MERFHYTPQGVCPMDISFELEGDVVHGVRFAGGCPGNLKAISKVVEGWTVGQIEEMFRGNTCGGKSTSCVDQLADAVRAAYDEANS